MFFTLITYISFRDENGNWKTAKNMGEPINTKAREKAPIVSPDGKYLFFTSDRSPQKSRDIFWVDTKIIDKLK